MSDNTEALRCADEIGGLPVSDFCEALGDDAAAHIRRLVAENEALRADAGAVNDALGVLDLCMAVEQIKALKADAERYRFIRDKNLTIRQYEQVLRALDEHSGEELDARIDAAKGKI